MSPFYVVIPARYGSSRLPAKPLKPLLNKPMVQWVYEAAQRSSALRVLVATDDQRIADAVQSFGGDVLLTREDHASGTDRLQEVAVHLALPDHAILVNVQGDEPLMPAAAIDQVAANLAEHAEASVATLSEPLNDVDECFNPNVVKLVTDQRGFALYFSRAPIPWARDNYETADRQLPSGGAQRHIGLYAYRVALLHEFVRWSPSPLERTEKLEQLRVLHKGHKIHVAEACCKVPAGVDTEADWRRVAQYLESQA